MRPRWRGAGTGRAGRPGRALLPAGLQPCQPRSQPCQPRVTALPARVTARSRGGGAWLRGWALRGPAPPAAILQPPPACSFTCFLLPPLASACLLLPSPVSSCQYLPSPAFSCLLLLAPAFSLLHLPLHVPDPSEPSPLAALIVVCGAGDALMMGHKGFHKRGF